MTHTHISPFTAVEGAPTADLDTVGGKGLSLARLTAYARVGVPEYWVVDPEERDSHPPCPGGRRVSRSRAPPRRDRLCQP